MSLRAKKFSIIIVSLFALSDLICAILEFKIGSNGLGVFDSFITIATVFIALLFFADYKKTKERI